MPYFNKDKITKVKINEIFKPVVVIDDDGGIPSTTLVNLKVRSLASACSSYIKKSSQDSSATSLYKNGGQNLLDALIKNVPDENDSAKFVKLWENLFDLIWNFPYLDAEDTNLVSDKIVHRFLQVTQLKKERYTVGLNFFPEEIINGNFNGVPYETVLKVTKNFIAKYPETNIGKLVESLVQNPHLSQALLILDTDKSGADFFKKYAQILARHHNLSGAVIESYKVGFLTPDISEALFKKPMLDPNKYAMALAILRDKYSSRYNTATLQRILTNDNDIISAILILDAGRISLEALKPRIFDRLLEIPMHALQWAEAVAYMPQLYQCKRNILIK